MWRPPVGRSRAVRVVAIVVVLLCGLFWPGALAAFDEDPYPRFVVNFYFGGTFGTGNEWKNDEAPWKTPALWESMRHYAEHDGEVNPVWGQFDDGSPNGLRTYHVYLPGIAANVSGDLDIFGDRPHCEGNPWGWEDVHSFINPSGAGFKWKMILITISAMQGDNDDKVIVNIAGQSRGGMSAIRFASELGYFDQGNPDARFDDRIAWINVVATDPVWDENASCTFLGEDYGPEDYTRWHHYVLGPKVRNYIGIYAEDERSSDFWPVLPHVKNPYPTYPNGTREVLLTVPGSHQTLVGNYQRDGHRPKKWLPGFQNTFLVWWVPPLFRPLDITESGVDGRTEPKWQSLQHAVTYLVLDLYETPEFGYTKFRYNGSPNYLDWAKDHVDTDQEWLDAMADARSGPGDLVKTMSFLPIVPSIYFRGKLMAWVGGACEQHLTWDSTKNYLYRNARCGMEATGTDPDGNPDDVGQAGDVDENTLEVGVNREPALLDSATVIIPIKTAQQMLNEIVPIRDDPTITYTIQTDVTTGGGSIDPPQSVQQVPFGGSSAIFEFHADPGFHLSDVVVDGTRRLGPVDSYQFHNVTRSGHTIDAEFTANPPCMYTTLPGPGGTISPGPVVEVPLFQTETFYIWGDGSNLVDEVIIDSASTGSLNVPNYTWETPTCLNSNPDDPELHTIEASFIDYHTVSTGVVPASAGVVTHTSPLGSHPWANGVNCDGDTMWDCMDPVIEGGFIDLVPTAGTDHDFAGWVGCDVQPAPNHPDPNSCRQTMDPDPQAPSGSRESVIAYFFSSLGGDDHDGDSILTEEEAIAPNDGDGNFDGIPDADQSSVASFFNRALGTYCTLELTDTDYSVGWLLESVEVQDETAFADDPYQAYPAGVFSFITDHQYRPVPVKVLVHGRGFTKGLGYRKYSTTSYVWETVPATVERVIGPSGEIAVALEFVYEISDGGVGDSVHGEELHAAGGPVLVDSDDDGIGDEDETRITGSDPFSGDTDGDGLTDAEEVVLGTEPGRADSNNDGVTDADQVAAGDDPLDPDSDGDGMPNWWELRFELNPFIDDSHLDPDLDGMSSLDEFNDNRLPTVDDRDGDGDGMPTYWEDQYGLDPESDDAGDDADGDGLTNLQEYLIGSDPTDPTSVPVELLQFIVD